MEHSTLAKFSFQYDESVQQHFTEILTKEAKVFLTELHRRFNKERSDLLQRRVLEQGFFNKGKLPVFPAETKNIRKSDWKAAPIPNDLLDRRVEITGPVDRKMMINALNSGAKTFMADLEDSTSPTWNNIMEGQQNLIDAVNRTISYHDEKRNKRYVLNDDIATLIVRPRGLHLNEKHLLIDGEAMSGSLADFGLYFFHNAKSLLEQGSAPYFYLPKLEHYMEARWWNQVFLFAQDYLGIPEGTIKATVLIETITASFQLDEIIYELKEHMAGLNCGRWDYIFSYIKKLRNQPGFIVPDRDQVTMTTPFMESYSKLVIQKCHKRGVHAIGGMAAQIPIKNDEEANELAFKKVYADKIREVKNGHDGTWVAHPGLVKLATDVFDTHMPGAHQIDKRRDEIVITEADLVKIPEGSITEEGIRKNINVGILYIENWLRGNGAVALYHLMEDAATAEISRTQVWQWLHTQASLDNGKKLDETYYDKIFEDEIKKLKQQVGEANFDQGKYKTAIALFGKLVKADDFEEFLTIPAYKYL